MKLATIGVEEWLNIHERSAKVDIAQSTIASLTMGELMALDGDGGAGFYDRLNAETMNYGWIEGSPEFKAQVAKLYAHGDPDTILQTNGATGANLLALLALVGPGDHVIAEYPTYAPLYEIPRSLGAEVEYWHLREENGWNPDVAELEELIRPNTKLICINNASNPLGTVLPGDVVRRIAELAESVGAYVLSDEVYLPLQDTEQFVSMADAYEHAVVANSLSKTYSVPGARIGWVCSRDRALLDRFRTFRDYTMICDGVFNDALAIHVLEHKEQILERNRALVLNNLAIAQEWIDAEPRVSWVPPKAVSTSFIRFDIPVSDEEFCLDVLKTDGLLLVPGSRFELPCGARLGYCAPEATLREGLGLLSQALRRFD